MVIKITTYCISCHSYLSNVFFFRHEIGNEAQSVLFAHVMEAAYFTLMTDTVALIGHLHQLGAEGTHNELSRVLGTVRLFLNDIGDGSAVRRIQSLILLLQ